MPKNERDWFEDYSDESEEIQVSEYDITSSASDFNISTVFDFIESGAVKIPGFQRNYVWDLTRASKLIESLLLGLPVPQVFLYERSRNEFLVIDGQQRLMTIYYFIHQRFPRKDKRVELRRIIDQYGNVPKVVLHNDTLFENFRLKLPERAPGVPNQFNGLGYETLGSYKTSFRLRPLRNIIIKQNKPEGDHSSMYEIFSRLNTGGVNLRPQEIRMSMYHSEFFDMLRRINLHQGWRRLLGNPEGDVHMKDVEILLRGFAMLISGREYRPSLVKFLNEFARKSTTNSPEQNQYLERLFESFIQSTAELRENIFFNLKTGRFNIALYEAVFAAVCDHPFRSEELIQNRLSEDPIVSIGNDRRFLEASQEGTTQKSNVFTRLNVARHFFGLEPIADQ